MPYTKNDWNSKETKLSPTNLNHIEDALEYVTKIAELSQDRIAEYDEAFKNITASLDSSTNILTIKIGNSNTPNVYFEEHIELPKVEQPKLIYRHDIVVGQERGTKIHLAFYSHHKDEYTPLDLFMLDRVANLSKAPLSGILYEGEIYEFVGSLNECAPCEIDFDFKTEHCYTIRLYRNSKNGTTKTFKWTEDMYFHEEEYGKFIFTDTVS